MEERVYILLTQIGNVIRLPSDSRCDQLVTEAAKGSGLLEDAGCIARGGQRY